MIFIFTPELNMDSIDFTIGEAVDAIEIDVVDVDIRDDPHLNRPVYVQLFI